jgi:hypothetical protein
MKDAEAPLDVVSACVVKGGGHERALSKLGRSIELLQGAQDGDLKRVSYALHDGADPEIRQAFVLFGRDKSLDNPTPQDRHSCVQRPRGPTPLMLAAKSGSVACIQMLLEFKANVAAEDEDGLKPIHYAAMSGELLAFQCLVAAQADPMCRDDQDVGVLEHLPEETRNDAIQFQRWEIAVMQDAAMGKRAAEELGSNRETTM